MPLYKENLKTMITTFKKEFDEFNEKICNSLYNYVEKLRNQEAKLMNYNCYYYNGEGIDCVHYDRLFIDDGKLMVTTTSGEGFEPNEAETETFEIDDYDIIEIYNLVSLIIE